MYQTYHDGWSRVRAVAVWSDFPPLHERDDKQDQEDNEQDLGDRGRGSCDDAKAQDTGEQGDDQKNDSVA